MKIGQIGKLQEEVKVISMLSDSTVKTYPKGTGFVVSADGFMVFPDGKRVKMPDDVKIEGYDIEAIALRIVKFLKRDTLIGEIIDDEDDYCSEKYFREVIEGALCDIF